MHVDNTQGFRLSPCLPVLEFRTAAQISDAVREMGENGNLAYHFAIKHCTEPELTAYILHLFPAAAATKNRCGFVPMTYAMDHSEDAREALERDRQAARALEQEKKEQQEK